MYTEWEQILEDEIQRLKRELYSFRSAADYVKNSQKYSVNGSGWAMIDPAFLSELLCAKEELDLCKESQKEN